MEWLVIEFRGGGRQVMTRAERETHIGAMIDMKAPIYSRVLKTFDNEEDAYKYLDNQNNADNLLNEILPE